MSMQTIDKENLLVQSAIEKERARLKKRRADIHKEMDDGAQITFEFTNNEDPPGNGNPLAVVRFFFEGKEFTAKHGDVLTWPARVVDHVNSLTRPVYGNEVDPVTGAIHSKRVSQFRRFTCLPVPEAQKPVSRSRKKDDPLTAAA
jgi:hypothetical protein